MRDRVTATDCPLTSQGNVQGNVPCDLGAGRRGGAWAGSFVRVRQSPALEIQPPSGGRRHMPEEMAERVETLPSGELGITRGGVWGSLLS